MERELRRDRARELLFGVPGMKSALVSSSALGSAAGEMDRRHGHVRLCGHDEGDGASAAQTRTFVLRLPDDDRGHPDVASGESCCLPGR